MPAKPRPVWLSADVGRVFMRENSLKGRVFMRENSLKGRVFMRG